jgi:hypothetical protein
MTKYNLIAAIGLLLASISTQAQQPEPKAYSAICIEHIGDSDKLIFPILISTSEDGVRWCRRNMVDRIPEEIVLTRVVSPTLMLQLTSEVDAIHGDKQAQSRPFGTFEITAFDPRGRQVVQVDKAEMLELIERLKKHCKGNPLYKDLLNLQARIAVGRIGETGATGPRGTTEGPGRYGVSCGGLPTFTRRICKLIWWRDIQIEEGHIL